MDEIRQIRPGLGLLFDHSPSPHMCYTCLPLVDGQDYEGGIQGGGCCEIIQDIFAGHRLRDVELADQLLIEEVPPTN